MTITSIIYRAKRISENMRTDNNLIVCDNCKNNSFYIIDSTDDKKIYCHKCNILYGVARRIKTIIGKP